MAEFDLNIPSIKLPDANSIPQIGYGSGTAWYKSSPGPTDQKLIDATKLALGMGYYHLDAAEAYNNEEEVGAAIAASKIPREKLFITTKVAKSVGDIPSAIDASLKKLGLDYVDLYLIHMPFFANGDETKLQTAWAAMEDVVAAGKARSIGVSNFLRPDIDAILKTAKMRPAVNQLEFHPYLQHGDLYSYLKNKDISIAAYAPLTPVTKAQGGPLDPILAKLAKKYAVNPAEILLRWSMDRGMIPITTSTKEQRMSDMLRTLTVRLTPKELDEISNIGNTYHFRQFFIHKFDENDRS